MFTIGGIAEADDLHPGFGMENSVVAAVADDIGAGCLKKFRRRLGTAGGEKQRDQALHFGRMRGVG